MQHSGAEGSERKIIWEGGSGFDVTQGSLGLGLRDVSQRVMADVLQMPQDRNDNKAQQRERAPEMTATHSHPRNSCPVYPWICRPALAAPGRVHTRPFVVFLCKFSYCLKLIQVPNFCESAGLTGRDDQMTNYS